MTIAAAILLLVSAILHASWNLLSKHESSTNAYFLVANSVGFLCLAPGLLIWPEVLAAFSAPVWGLVVLTGIFQAVYFAGLTGSYRTGDLSVAYPLLRSFPVVAVPLVTLLLGQGRALSGQFMAGAGLVVVGCLLIPLRGLADWRPQTYWRYSSLFALLAGLGTTGYLIVDDMALRRLRTVVSGPSARVETAVVYAVLEGASTSLCLLLLVLAQKRLPDLRRALSGWRQPALTGAGMYAAYLLVLIAMGFVQNVSYVIALRQLSILFGALLGILVLKEPRSGPKWVGIAVLVGGLILAGTG